MLKIYPLNKWRVQKINKYPPHFPNEWVGKTRVCVVVGESSGEITWWLPEILFQKLQKYELYFTYSDEHGFLLFDANDHQVEVP